MKKIIFILLLLVFAYQIQAQKKQAPIQQIGLKSHFRVSFTDLIFGAGLGIDLEYNRSFYNQKHFLSTGIGVHLNNMERPIETDNAREKPWDHTTFVSIPIHYIYQPVSWLYVRTLIVI